MVLGDNPILMVDPNGDNWFYYKGKGDKAKTWHWAEGNKTSYETSSGKNKTISSTYEYLVKFNITGKNTQGAAEAIFKSISKMN